jgi:anti-anti-sigma regulatory factor
MLKELKTKTTITLGETVNALDISELKNAFSKALERNLPLEVQCKKVAAIDTLSCQLLVSAQNTFNAKSLSYSHLEETEALTRAFTRLGLNKNDESKAK